MIYGNTQNLSDYTFLIPAIHKCFEFSLSHDLASFPKGRHTIDGDHIFVNIVEYETSPAEDRIWESHKRYLDFHLMLVGREQVDLNHTHNMSVGEYQNHRDFLPMDGSKVCSLVLNPGDFLICYPSDGHRTGIAVSSPEPVKKAIFKIQI